MRCLVRASSASACQAALGPGMSHDQQGLGGLILRCRWQACIVGWQTKHKIDPIIMHGSNGRLPTGGKSS
jgi:hypothetical protein